jgi:hypothetical protein
MRTAKLTGLIFATLFFAASALTLVIRVAIRTAAGDGPGSYDGPVLMLFLALAALTTTLTIATITEKK